MWVWFLLCVYQLWVLLKLLVLCFSLMKLIFKLAFCMHDNTLCCLCELKHSVFERLPQWVWMFTTNWDATAENPVSLNSHEAVKVAYVWDQMQLSRRKETYVNAKASKLFHTKMNGIIAPCCFFFINEAMHYYVDHLLQCILNAHKQLKYALKCISFFTHEQSKLSVCWDCLLL